ncbi:MAG: glycoside hydrolase family 9 protein, partial [Bacteroidota bacterium]
MANLRILFISVFFTPLFPSAQSVKVLTNHIGYEVSKAKHAVVLVDKQTIFKNGFQLVDEVNGRVAFTGKIIPAGSVNKWKHWLFWTMDFSSFVAEGTYRLQVSVAGKTFSSFPFIIGKNVLEQSTLSDVIYYFKGQRSSGLLNAADHHLLLAGKTTDTIDAHGGWYDASGDYGKHLSHLSFSSYFNPQQISLTAWSLLKTYERLINKSGTDYRQYNRRILDEAMYGADYLVRMQVPGGSFYRSVSAPGPGKFAKDRVIRAEDKSYRIKQTKDQSFGGNSGDTAWKSYQVSFRSGGGMAIAALAIASMHDTSGDFSNKEYLAAAERAFDFLSKNNAYMTNDGKENIVDDYCALNAATELYKATQKD